LCLFYCSIFFLTIFLIRTKMLSNVKISRKTEYAIRGMIYLAKQPRDQFVMVKEINQSHKDFSRISGEDIPVAQQCQSGGIIKGCGRRLQIKQEAGTYYPQRDFEANRRSCGRESLCCRQQIVRFFQDLFGTHRLEKNKGYHKWVAGRCHFERYCSGSSVVRRQIFLIINKTK